jgi:hypothetical protein
VGARSRTARLGDGHDRHHQRSAIISAAAYQLVLGAAFEEPANYLMVGLGMALGALTFYFADRWVDNLGGEERMDLNGAQAGG